MPFAPAEKMKGKPLTTQEQRVKDGMDVVKYYDAGEMAEIAIRLDVTPHTLRVHRWAIRTKLGIVADPPRLAGRALRRQEGKEERTRPGLFVGLLGLKRSDIKPSDRCKCGLLLPCFHEEDMAWRQREEA